MRPEPGSEAMVAAWQALCAALEQRLGDTVTPLGCGFLAAVALGISADSRGFARDFGLSHALVLREVTSLSQQPALIAVTRLDPRTQRSFVALTEAGKALTDHLMPA